VIVGIVQVGSDTVEEFRTATDLVAGVASFCAEHSPPLVPADYLGIDGTGVDLSKQWTWDGAALIQIGWREPILAQITDHREKRLATVILAEYPSASGLMFGCSTADQDNWNKLATLDTRGLVTYPFTAHTADHAGSYDLVSSADLTGALGTISLAVLTERNLAETYLAAVVAAPDEASAEAAAAPYLT